MRLLLILLSYVGLRICLHVLFPNLWVSLSSFVELCTPISSFRSTKEGLYLFNQLSVSPYKGNIFQQSPLMIALFTIVPEQLHFLVFTFFDVFAAYNLASFASTNMSYSPSVVAASYLFNPFSLLSSLANSTNVIGNSCICASLGFLGKKKAAKSIFFFSLACVLMVYPFYLSFNYIILAAEWCNSRWYSVTFKFLFFICCFFTLAFIPFQSWKFLNSQFVSAIVMRDLSRPNIGLWWYFFIELFSEFRPFYTCVFQLYLVSLQVPLAIRFPKQKLFAFTLLVGFLATFKPYPELSDIGLYITMLLLNKPVFDLMHHKVYEILGFVYFAALSPAFYYLWISSGSGNANFFYAINLVYAATMIVLFSDHTWAAIRYEYDGGKDKTVTQI